MYSHHSIDSLACTAQQYLQQLGSPIKVFASMPHAHLAGTAVRTKLVRNGVFQSYVGRDETYDFDLQEIRLLDPEVIVQEVNGEIA